MPKGSLLSMQSRSRIALEAFIALNDSGGGYYGMSGAPGVPRKWLEETPFDSYVVPSLILFVVVAGSAVMAKRKLPFAREASLSAGLVLLSSRLFCPPRAGA